jgi:hypothetical protein
LRSWELQSREKRNSEQTTWWHETTDESYPKNGLTASRAKITP